jgi:hypothetical protein
LLNKSSELVQKKPPGAVSVRPASPKFPSD